MKRDADAEQKHEKTFKLFGWSSLKRDYQISNICIHCCPSQNHSLDAKMILFILVYGIKVGLTCAGNRVKEPYDSNAILL